MTRAKLYVPTGVPSDVSTEVKHEIAERFGGYTAYEADGGWMNEKGELIEESVTVIEVVTEKKVPRVHTRINNLALYVWQVSDESVVLFTVDSEKYTVP